MGNPAAATIILIGCSAGGVEALKLVLGELSRDFPAAIVIVQHIAVNSGDTLAQLLDDMCDIQVKEAEENEIIQAGIVYLAPANYHLMIEPDRTFALSIDPPVSYARPSIDVLFESAALLTGVQLIGVILTGANADGSTGLKKISEAGGVTIVQDPASARAANMPEAALQAVHADHIVALENLSALLIQLVHNG
jgi:two-component system chemotaxis response regulator CheB